MAAARETAGSNGNRDFVAAGFPEFLRGPEMILKSVAAALSFQTPESGSVAGGTRKMPDKEREKRQNALAAVNEGAADDILEALQTRARDQEIRDGQEGRRAAGPAVRIR